MKSTVPIALVSLILGIAIGWLAKPDPSPTLAGETHAESPSRQGPRETADPAAPNRAGPGRQTPPVDAESKPERRFVAGAQIGEEEQRVLEEAQSQQQKMIARAIRSKFDLRISALVNELGLDADQEKELRAYYDEQIKIIEQSSSPMMGEIPEEEEIAKVAAAMRGAGLSEHLSEHLDGDQIEALTAYQDRQEQNAIEARALKSFAKVQSSLDLTEQQRDQVYEVILGEATEWRENQSDLDFIARESMSSMGMDMDFGDMDMGSVMQFHDPADLESGDAMAAMTKLKAEQEKRVDERVARMEPILNETQLVRYRQSIEKGGFLNMMLGAGFESEVEPIGEPPIESGQ